jgi:hypothetical protein
MEIKFFSSLAKESAKSMFVIDKHGRTILFPWGTKKQGYLVKDKNLELRALKFYSYTFSVYFIVLVIMTALFHSFWAIVSVFLVCSISTLFVHYFYTTKITKSLTAVKASYKEIVLEKIAEDVSKEEESQFETRFPVKWSRSISQPKRDSFSSLNRFWSRLSPGYLAIASFLTGFLAAAIGMSYHPQKYSGVADSWLVFFPCFFFGLGGFIFTIYGEAPQEGILGFTRWKLPMIGVMIGFWLLAFWSLYDYVMAIVK